MSRHVLYPGTFDPVTYGHIDIIKRGTGIFPELIVAVAANPYKKPLFNVQERVDMLSRAVSGLPGVSIEAFDGLVVDFAAGRKLKCSSAGCV